MIRTVEIFGIAIHAVDMPAAVREILEWLDASRRECRFVVTPNVDHIVKLQRLSSFKKAYANASLVLVDGRPVLWASKLIGKPLPDVVPGSDLVPALFDAICANAAPIRVFLLGAAPGVAERARSAIGDRWRTLSVVDTFSPPFGFENDASMSSYILERIRQAQTDLLLVGLGAPKQELWVHAHQAEIAAKAVLCIGATIDFLAGVKKRAPRWMRTHGLEWVHRMASEPRRLTSRYFHDLVVFPQLVAGELMVSRTQAIERVYREAKAALAEHVRFDEAHKSIDITRGPPNGVSGREAEWLLSACEAPIVRLVQRIDNRFPNRRGRVIHFMGVNHAAGASSVASAYARAAAMLHGHRVLLIAVDHPAPALGILDAMLEGRSLSQAVIHYETSVSRGALNGEQKPEERAHALISGRGFWKQLRHQFDEIIFEGGSPAASSFSLEIASNVDAVLLVVEAERTRVDVAKSVLRQLLSVKANVMGTVLNKSRQYKAA